MKTKKECEICGRSNKNTHKRQKFDNKILCKSHYAQMEQYGKIVKKDIAKGIKWTTLPNKFKDYPLKGYALIEIRFKDNRVKIKIDSEDLNKCKKYHWSMNDYKNVYSNIRDKNNKPLAVPLHRFLMNNPENYIVRRKTEDYLDYRKSNLELFPASKPNIKSGKGISWESSLKKRHVKVFCGRYTKLEDAEKISKFVKEKLKEYKQGD